MPHGGPTPDRVKSTMKRLGLEGVNKPKRQKSGGKSHVVMAHYGTEYKVIRFGQAGVTTAGKKQDARSKARRKSFKARHAKNIAKGPSSAAYWANKVKW